MTPMIRPATLADASALAVLVDIAGEGAPSWFWSSLAGPGQSALAVGRDRARREEGGFSYRHATIAQVGAEIAACSIVYPLDDPYDLTGLDTMPPLAQPLVRLEAQAPGSWYVNVLATFPEFRGHGIGALLLDLAEAQGRAANAPAMSVIVGSWNVIAAALYARAGYVATAFEPALLPPDFPHHGDWLLMVKSLR
jgi:ribosomal protein S18 acetylase RimI-like enzyme